MSGALYIIARVGQDWIAMPASAVESVARVGDITPVPGAPAAVPGLVAVRARILTLVDCASLVDAGTSAHDGAAAMAIVVVDGHGYGLLLSEVDAVVTLGAIEPCPARFTSRWAAMNPRLADHGGQLLLVVDPAAFVRALAPLGHAA